MIRVVWSLVKTQGMGGSLPTISERREADYSNQCVVLQTPLVDGSPCGYGGHCYNASCQSGPWQDRFEEMYTQNLQISIPVTIVVGIIVSSPSPPPSLFPFSTADRGRPSSYTYTATDSTHLPRI